MENSRDPSYAELPTVSGNNFDGSTSTNVAVVYNEFLDEEPTTSNVKAMPIAKKIIHNEILTSSSKQNINYGDSGLLLADTAKLSIPEYVCNLFRNYGDLSELTPSEILFHLVYIVALESGFISDSDYEENADELERISSCFTFHCGNVRLITNKLPTFLQKSSKSLFSMRLYTLVHSPQQKEHHPLYNNESFASLLTCFVTGECMIFTLSPIRTEIEVESYPGRSISLSVPRYVLGTIADTSGLSMRLRNMNELSRLLRDVIFIPIRNYHLELAEFSVYPSLSGLPCELYDNILKYMDPFSILNMRLVNHDLNDFVTNSKYFLQLFQNT